MRTFLISIPFILLFVAAGCSIYEPNIQQGNVIEADKLAQVKLGMDKKQVMFLLGTPLVKNDFRPERWDYVYFYLDKENHTRSLERVAMYFSEGKLAKIDKVPETTTTN